jgi:anti-sigma B factor antagonist
MTVNKEKKGNTLFVSVEGRVDTATAGEFESEIKSGLDGISELVLDFSDLNYISSAGLRVLLSLQKIMNTQGEMKITGVNEIVNDIFEVTGFSEILTIV